MASENSEQSSSALSEQENRKIGFCSLLERSAFNSSNSVGSPAARDGVGQEEEEES